MVDDGELDAGAFSPWLAEMQGALAGANGSDVACQGCTACCTSSQFIPIGPDETDTLARIPPPLLFPAPRRPGHFVLGYDERGHCPMLVDNQCSIYQNRPRTCRTYDCRVFPAAGVDLDDETKALIGYRTRQWRFSFPTRADRERHAAVQAAGRFLLGVAAISATERAVLAVEIHGLFLGPDAPDPDAVTAAVRQLMAR